jgi:hypothetical protein
VSADAETRPLVIRISPIAYIADGFLALGLLAVVFAGPPWVALVLLVPVALAIAVARYRTVADKDTVTARTLLKSDTVEWSDVDGLRFDKSSWASARLKSGRDLRLPAVTFSTLPRLAEASGGRVPNPYQ